MNEKTPYRKIKCANQLNTSKQKMDLFKFVFLVSLISLTVITYQVFYGNNNAFDNWAFDIIKPYIINTRTQVILFFSFLGSHTFLIPAWFILVFLYYFLCKNMCVATKILCIGLFNLILMFSLKYLFNRPRPATPLLSEASGLSFPSGHAFMGFTFFTIIIYLVYRDVKNVFIKCALIITLIFVIIMIGFSRIYLGLHYTTDVIAGYCFGIISFSFFYYVQNIFYCTKKNV